MESSQHNKQVSYFKHNKSGWKIDLMIFQDVYIARGYNDQKAKKEKKLNQKKLRDSRDMIDIILNSPTEKNTVYKVETISLISTQNSYINYKIDGQCYPKYKYKTLKNPNGLKDLKASKEYGNFQAEYKPKSKHFLIKEKFK